MNTAVQDQARTHEQVCDTNVVPNRRVRHAVVRCGARPGLQCVVGWVAIALSDRHLTMTALTMTVTRRCTAIVLAMHRQSGPGRSSRLTVRLRKCASVPTSIQSATPPVAVAPVFRSFTISVGCGWSCM